MTGAEFHEAYGQHKDVLYRFARRMTGSASVAGSEGVIGRGRSEGIGRDRKGDRKGSIGRGQPELRGLPESARMVKTVTVMRHVG
jgi:hypothetical protein